MAVCPSRTVVSKLDVSNIKLPSLFVSHSSNGVTIAARGFVIKSTVKGLISKHNVFSLSTLQYNSCDEELFDRDVIGLLAPNASLEAV